MVDQNPTRTKNVLQPRIIMNSDIKTLPDTLNESVLHQKYTLEGLSAKQIAMETTSELSEGWVRGRGYRLARFVALPA